MSYHKYVYDRENRRILEGFEQAYANCEDTWPTQHDTHIQKFQLLLFEALKRGEEARVLDIGAGYGDFVALLHHHGISATGVDISPSAVEKGLLRFPGITLQTGDLRDGLDFEDNSFNMILLLGVFWFLLETRDQCLQEVRRVLMPEGDFYISISMVEDPIGKEIMGNYEDFVAIVREHFRVQEIFMGYDFRAINEGKLLAESMTDMTLRCTVDE